MMKTVLTALALAAAPTMAAAQATDANTFLMKAGASDQYEIQSSKLVMASKNPKVKSFARDMVRDHTKSTAEVKQAAMAAKLKAPKPMLDEKGASNVAALKAASGEQRDALYIEQQKTSHQEALALHQTYAASGDTPALQAVAGKIAPVVEHHIMELNAM